MTYRSQDLPPAPRFWGTLKSFNWVATPCLLAVPLPLGLALGGPDYSVLVHIPNVPDHAVVVAGLALSAVLMLVGSAMSALYLNEALFNKQRNPDAGVL